MGLANGTRVAVPDGVQLIELITVEDQVLASGSPLQWSPVSVAFNAGTGGGQQPVMVYVQWDGGGIITTPDHVYVLQDFTLSRADTLRPGDVLLAGGGTGAAIVNIALGQYVGGVHEIATDAPWDPDSLAGRLLDTGGVVTGDFQLQMHMIQDGKPVIGTAAYGELHATVRHLP